MGRKGGEDFCFENLFHRFVLWRGACFYRPFLMKQIVGFGAIFFALKALFAGLQPKGKSFLERGETFGKKGGEVVIFAGIFF